MSNRTDTTTPTVLVTLVMIEPEADLTSFAFYPTVDEAMLAAAEYATDLDADIEWASTVGQQAGVHPARVVCEGEVILEATTLLWEPGRVIGTWDIDDAHRLAAQNGGWG